MASGAVVAVAGGAVVVVGASVVVVAGSVVVVVTRGGRSGEAPSAVSRAHAAARRTASAATRSLGTTRKATALPTLRGVQVVEIEVAAEEVELAADALWQAGASAVSEETAPDGRVRLRADVAAAAAVEPRWQATLIEPDTEAHLDAWRAFARPVLVGPLRLQPAWIPYEARPGEVVVQLDPGRAFGSGAHPSTRLALEAVVSWLPWGGRVLDIGCGSGVLAIAAVLLGAGEVQAIDVDPEAVRATETNAARNGASIDVARAAAADALGSFDLVVANIGAGVLIEEAAAIAACVAPGGHLVLAGLLEGRADDVAAAYEGAREVARRTDDGWTVLVLQP